MQRPEKVRQPHLEIGEQRQIGPRSGDLLKIDQRGYYRLLENRALSQNATPVPGHHAPTLKRLSALTAHAVSPSVIDPMLGRDVLDQAPPARQTHRAPRRVVGGDYSARGTRAWDNDQLGAVQRGKHGGEGM